MVNEMTFTARVRQLEARPDLRMMGYTARQTRRFCIRLAAAMVKRKQQDAGRKHKRRVMTYRAQMRYEAGPGRGGRRME